MGTICFQRPNLDKNQETALLGVKHLESNLMVCKSWVAGSAIDGLDWSLCGRSGAGLATGRAGGRRQPIRNAIKPSPGGGRTVR